MPKDPLSKSGSQRPSKALQRQARRRTRKAVFGSTQRKRDRHFLGWLGEVDPDELFASGKAWGLSVTEIADDSEGPRRPRPAREEARRGPEASRAQMLRGPVDHHSRGRC